MQHAVALSGEEDEPSSPTAILSDKESHVVHPSPSEPIKLALSYTWSGIKYLFHLLHPLTIHNGYKQFRQMTYNDMIKNLFVLLFKCIRLLFFILICVLRYVTKYYLTHGFDVIEFLFSLHVFLILKCILSKRCYCNITRKFEKLENSFQFTKEPSTISQHSQSSNDNRYFFNTPQLTQYSNQSLERSDSSNFHNKKNRFAA